MRSTGEVMGISRAFWGWPSPSGCRRRAPLPTRGRCSSRSTTTTSRGWSRSRRPAPRARLQARRHPRHGRVPGGGGVPIEAVLKVDEGRPDVLDLIRGGLRSSLVINTPLGQKSFVDDGAIRKQGDPAGRARLHHPHRRPRPRLTPSAPRGLRSNSFEVDALQEILKKKKKKKKKISSVELFWESRFGMIWRSPAGAGTQPLTRAWILELAAQGVAAHRLRRSFGRRAGGGRVPRRRQQRRRSSTRLRACTRGSGCAAGAAGFFPAPSSGVLIDQFLPRERFEDSPPPPRRARHRHGHRSGLSFFGSGNVRDAVRASCSFPGIFPPFIWEGRRLLRRRRHRCGPGEAGPRTCGRRGGRDRGGRQPSAARSGRPRSRRGLSPCARG